MNSLDLYIFALTMNITPEEKYNKTKTNLINLLQYMRNNRVKWNGDGYSTCCRDSDIKRVEEKIQNLRVEQFKPLMLI